MTVEDLPHYIMHDIFDEDDPSNSTEYRFFLTISRDLFGQWSCGYVAFANEDHSEFAIPELVTNSSDNLNEIAVRMAAKIKRFNRE